MGQLAVQKRLGSGMFLLLIILLSAFAPISTDMYLPALGTMMSDLGTSESILNMTLYGYMFALAVSMLVFGPLIDKYGRKGILLVCLVEYIIVSFLSAFVTEVYSLIVLRVLQAVGSAGVMTISTAFIKDTYDGPDMSRALNIVAVIGVLGPILAPIIGSALIEVWGWRSTFIAPALFAVVCLVISIFVTETLPSGSRVEGGMAMMLNGMKGLFKDGSFMFCLLMIAVFNLPFMAYLSVSSYIYEDGFGLSPTSYSMMLAVAMIVSILSMIIVNKLTAKVVNRKMLPLYLFLGLLSAVLLLTVGDRTWWMFFVSFIFVMIAGMTIRPWGMGIIMRSHPGDNGAVSSLINFLFFLYGTIGMILSTIGWSSFVSGLGVLSLMACIIYVVMYAGFRKCGISRIVEMNMSPSGSSLNEKK